MAKLGGGEAKVLEWPNFGQNFPRDEIGYAVTCYFCSAIDFFAMANAKHQNRDLGILNPADDAIVPDPVTPEACQIVSQRLAKTARIFSGCNFPA